MADPLLMALVLEIAIAYGALILLALVLLEIGAVLQDRADRKPQQD